MKICFGCGAAFDHEEWVCPFCKYKPEIINDFHSFSPDLARANDGFDPKAFSQLFDLETDHFWFRSRNKLLIWALQNYFPDAKSYLEIGCGTGFVLSEVESENPGLSIFGSEIYVDGLAFAKKRVNKAVLFQMDARQIPFEKEFDLIGAFDVLEHIEEDELVLKQMYKACKPGGGIIITVPQHKWLWSYVDEYSFHKRRYSRHALVDKLERAGFEVTRSTSFVSLLLPLMYISRFNTQSKESYDPNKEMEIGRLRSKLLESIMTIERKLIKNGISMPVGGSLLLLANKVK